MYSNLVRAASTIGKPNNDIQIVDAMADTQDVIDLIELADCHAWQQTTEFSRSVEPSMRGMEALWKYIRSEINYVPDDDERMVVKSPEVVIQDKIADCKSMSLFIGSVIHNLRMRGYDIDHDYRFVSYNNSKVISHVYPVVYLGGQEIIMDAVHDTWNEELDYTYKIDVPSCEDTGIGITGTKERYEGIQKKKWIKPLAFIAGGLALYRLAFN